MVILCQNPIECQILVVADKKASERHSGRVLNSNLFVSYVNEPAEHNGDITETVT